MTNSEFWYESVRRYNSGNLSGAAEICTKILQDSPDDSLAHWLMSCISIDSGHPRAAASHALQAATEAVKLPVPDRLKISWSLIVTGETQKAFELLSTMTPEADQHVATLFEVAHQLSMIEFPVHAMRLLDRAVSNRMFVPPEICMLKGHLHSTLGMKTEAEQLLEDAIAFGAPTPRPHLLLSRLNIARGRPERIDRLRKLVRSVNGPPEWIAMFHYSLFNELDGESDHDEAWKALVDGARTVRNSIRYDPVQESEIFTNLARAFETGAPGFSRSADSAESDMPVPIFIVGLPRTGTTLVEQILGNHPDVCAGGELPTLAQQIQWVSDRVWDGPFDIRASIESGSLDSGELGQRYLRGSEWRMHGSRYFTDKNPRNFASIGNIVRALPQAKIVHVHRDPIDACFSNFKMLFGPGAYPYSYDLSDLAFHHRNYSALMKSWNRLYPDRILNVSYEELVRERGPVSARMLEFCGLSPRSDVLDFSDSSRAIMTESRSQLRSGIQDRYIGAWRKYERYLEPLVSKLQNPV